MYDELKLELSGDVQSVTIYFRVLGQKETKKDLSSENDSNGTGASGLKGYKTGILTRTSPIKILLGQKDYADMVMKAEPGKKGVITIYFNNGVYKVIKLDENNSQPSINGLRIKNSR